MKKSAVILMLLLSGCSVMPDYQRPETALMASWSENSGGSDVVSREWWASFGSSELNILMAEALTNNHELKGSLARIEQARAALKSTRSGLFPSVNASVGTSQSDNDGDYSDSWRAGAGISYEVDLFGAVGSSVSASAAQLKGSEYTHEATVLVLQGDVATTYFELLNAKERLQIADENIKIAEDIQRIIEKRFDAGLDSALEVSQQTSSVQSAKASRAALEANLRTTETALAVLLGRVPTDDLTQMKTLADLKVPDIVAGVPSDLITRRPDIRKAEADLVAANANIGVARAALYPSVTLGLDWKLAASGFGNPATSALALASSLATPIFQGGRLEAGVEQATARQAELIEAYRQIVLTSFKEVEDALAQARSARLREEALLRARQEAQKSYDLSEARYKAGSVDFQTLLSTQAQLFQAKDAYLQTKNAQLAAAIQLYKALGGGWISSQ